ncbi:MAG: adenine phosphoribosyltransferase [Brevinema sp.]
MDYSPLIRRIPGYPKPGIIFEDLTTLWKDPEAFAGTLRLIADQYKDKGITKVVGLEARGFVLAAPIACMLNAGFVPIRKAGKLPSECISTTYDLEYGKAEIALHTDALTQDDKVLICDDILATGGTLEAALFLIRQLKAEISGVALLQELTYLNGRSRLPGVEIFSLYKVNE